MVGSWGIETRILAFRGQRVLLGQDLARLYQVRVKVLNQAVKRNGRRFPEDFVFRLTPNEVRELRSQSVTASRRNARHLPLAITEHGALMAANVLRSPVAVRASLEVVRAFVRLRSIISSHRDLARRLDDLERHYDRQFKPVFDAIRGLMEPEEDPPKTRIGFHP